MDSCERDFLSEAENLKQQARRVEIEVGKRTADLRHQLECNRMLTDNAASSLILVDREGRILLMNPAAETATGYGLEQALGESFHELTHHCHPDGSPYPASQCPIESAMEKAGNIKDIEETLVTRDGRFLPVSCSVVSFKAQGMRTGAVVEFQDITERKIAVSRLQRSEDRYRRLFETAQDGILILDADGGQIMDANPFLIELLGYSRKELIGKQLWELGFFQDIESNRAAFRALKKKGYIRYEDLPLKTKQGIGCDVEFISNSYEVGEEKVIQCNIRDITARKLAERALHVSEESLRQSKKLEALGKLAGGIAHDFNNLLTVITGYADLAQSMIAAKGPLQDTLKEILKAAERATGLTRQLLAFGRQQILAPKILGLNAIVTDMHGMLTRLIGASLSIREDLEKGLGRVKIDLVQMQQILMNLVINARDAMPQGGEITITTRNMDLDREYADQHPAANPKNYVMLSVRDTGTGMDADVKARVFDPFFTTKQIGKGSGMGLATVHGIVGQSGGHIVVDSRPGKGSDFRIYLPRMDWDEALPVLIPSPADAFPEQGFETVLLAEDEEMVRTLVRTSLENFGYTVLEAADGNAAMDLVRTYSEPIDLLLTDLLMGGMTGIELAKEFSLLRPESQVMYMSGYTDDIMAQQGLVERGNRFIQKPFTPTQLAKAVRDVLNRSTAKA